MEDSEEAQRQTTWTASLKRGMMKMLSKGSSSSSSNSRDSRSMQHAAAAAVSSASQPHRSTGGASQAPGDPSGGGGVSPGTGGPSLNVRGTVIRPQHAASFKGLSHSPSSTLLSPIGSANSPASDPSIKSGRTAQRTSSVGVSPLDAEASHARMGKPSLDFTSSSPGQGKGLPGLASAASLPVSGLKGTFQSPKAAGMSCLESVPQGHGLTPQPFSLAPQPSQAVQTVQQMLADMQSEKRAHESAGGRQSPRTASLGLAAMTDSVTSIGEGRGRHLGNGPGHEPYQALESPFADSLTNKSFATSISRRYAMAGTSECVSRFLAFSSACALMVACVLKPRVMAQHGFTLRDACIKHTCTAEDHPAQ